MLHKKALQLRPGVRQLRIAVREENQPESHAEYQQRQRLKGIERLHEQSSANRGKSLIRMLRDFSRKAKPSLAPAALQEFQVQSLGPEIKSFSSTVSG